MPVDMKEIIAEAAEKILKEKNIKKLTVKDIVEECRITRQTFYYHFEDIMDLFRWVLEKRAARMLQEAQVQGGLEQGLRNFFLIAVNAVPYLKKGMQTNYWDELERMMVQHVYQFFEQVIEMNHLYQSCSRSEVKLILRYHSQAVMGLLREWTEEDTKNLEQIVHQVFLLMTGEISPLDQN